MGSTPNFPFHEWISKTNFSFLSSTSHPRELLKAAALLGYESICVNDFDGVYGLARAFNDLKHLKKHHDVELRLNYGAEIHIFEDHDLPILKQVTICLNSTSLKGYVNLNKILTYAHKDSKDRAFIDLETLLSMELDGVFCIVPFRGAFRYFSENKKQLINLKSALNNRIYLAITKIFHKNFDYHIDSALKFSQEMGISYIYSQDSFMTKRSDKSFHDLLCAIKHNIHIKDAGALFFPNTERCLHDKAHIHKTYKDIGNFKSTIQLMEALSENCNFSFSELKYQYPKEMIPEGYTPQSFLEKISWEGARKRFGEHLSESIRNTISKELDLIEDLGYADYFITVWDIVAWARAQDILCQGRGSAANSAVCYVLGVTSCDPTTFDLLFERFISKERGDPPDIDIDFEHERREEVLQYIYRRYGRNRASMVANVITFKRKGALRAVGKAFGAKESTLKSVSDTTSTVMFRSKNLSQVLYSVSEDAEEKISWKMWNHFSVRLLNFPRHMGLHSGGFIISQHPITNLVAQEPATMEDRTIIQWSKDDIEELGFFKIDCLALGMLTAVRKCFDYVKECYGVDLKLHSIPKDDPATFSMIQRADTVGVFQIESRAQMSMLPRLLPKNLYDLVIEVAIIRPGPIQGKVIHPYLRRRDGLEETTFPDERVKDILAKTLGVIIFQEQMMRIAIALGDFTPGEADELRKHIGSWNSKSFSRDLDPHLSKLISGMKAKNIDEDFINQMLEHMQGFSHYGFPESHAISFAFIAYASSYLKCHYPAAFFTSVLNSQPMGFYKPHALLQAAKRAGVPLRKITINDSFWDHTLETIETNKDRPKRFAIRIGFRIVSGISEKAVLEITSKRKEHGIWKDFDSFLKSVEIYRDDYSALAAADAFSCFGLERSDALWMAEAVPFKTFIDLEERKLKWSKKSSLEKFQLDFTATGTTLGVHPVSIVKKEHWSYSIALKEIKNSDQLAKFKGRGNVIVFGMLLIKQAPPSAKGMVFFTLEDETGFINLAFPPPVYQVFYKEIEGASYLCVGGEVQKIGEYHSILVAKVYDQDSVDSLDKKRQTLKIAKEKSLNIRNLLPRNYQ